MSVAYFNGKALTGPMGPQGPDGNPIGSIISYLGSTAPEGYLVCDGKEYQIADHSQLAAFFEKEFGSKNHFGGDGTSTFAVPDFRTSNSVNAAVQYCIKAMESTAAFDASNDIYSTEETRIGTWINRKPLYRRVCTATSPSSVKDANQYVMSLGYDVALVSVSGTITSSAGASVQLPSLGCVGTNCQIYAGLPDVRADGKIYMGVHHTNYTSQPITFTLKYTKTTDQATGGLPE